MRKMFLIGIAVLGVLGASIIAITMSEQEAQAAAISRIFTAQKTVMSTASTYTGHEGHQVVSVVPLRDDGKIWEGTVTWTASKPVEISILHSYIHPEGDMKIHGEPALAPLGDATYAQTLVKVDSGTAVPSGSLQFSASYMGFHTSDGTPFTVTYTVHASAWNTNQ